MPGGEPTPTPRPLQNPIPVYSGFTHSLQTSLYWAKEGGKPIVMATEMDFCEMLWSRYREVAEEHGRHVPRGEEAAWGGYLVLADTKSEAEAWAEDCLWMWDSWSTPFGQDRPPLLIGDADTVTRMIEDVITESRRRLEALNPATVADVRNAGRPVVGFSSNFAAADQAIKDFLYPRLYRHDRIMRIMHEAEALVRRLFERFVQKPSEMPPEWLAGIEPSDAIGRALRIADYIAGMTDRYAIEEHRRLFGSAPELR